MCHSKLRCTYTSLRSLGASFSFLSSFPIPPFSFSGAFSFFPKEIWTGLSRRRCLCSSSSVCFFHSLLFPLLSSRPRPNCVLRQKGKHEGSVRAREFGVSSPLSPTFSRSSPATALLFFQSPHPRIRMATSICLCYVGSSVCLWQCICVYRRMSVHACVVVYVNVVSRRCVVGLFVFRVFGCVRFVLDGR